MIFDFNIPFLAIILFGIALFLLIPFVFVYLRPLWKVPNAIRRESDDTAEPSATYPVSVIVFTADESESLKQLLPSILNQNYDGPFEVIVVNDGESDSVTNVVERLRTDYTNLYITYTPDGARNLSRKKLALMLGIKAARYPVVLNTTASAIIDSDRWLARMTEPFVNPATEVVIGRSVPDGRDTGFGSRTRVFNTVADAMAWLNGAVTGHPYRGTELNLAYTREAFFANRGFHHSLNLHYGDDDIFISEIARPDNTAIVLHPDAAVRHGVWNARRAYREMRSRYGFTGNFVSKTQRRMQALGAWLLWAIIGLCVAGAVVMFPNMLGVCVAAFVVPGVLLASILLWRRAVRELGQRRLLLTLPWLMLSRPFNNIFTSLRNRRYRSRNYTWVK